MPKRSSLTIVALVALAACNGIAGPSDFRGLAHAKARWDARPFADYRFEIRTDCFCPPEITQWVRVSVRDGEVVAAEAVEPNPNYGVASLSYWQPIDSLFSRLHRVMAEGSVSSFYEAVIVEYDAELGYPTYIAYHAKSNVLDGGSAYSVRNVQPLN